MGEVAVQSILKARDENGKFQTLADLCGRVDTRAVNRKALEALIKCGACDGLGETRATLFAGLDRVMARAASNATDRERGQASLFSLLPEPETHAEELTERFPEWPQHELLAHEKELVGFYVTGHPLTVYASLLEQYGLANTSTLAELPNRSLTRIGGLVAAVQTGVSKKSGRPYAMVQLEDLHGSVQVLCMNENYEKHRELLVPNKAVLIVGEVNIGDDKPKIFPQDLMPLEEAPARFTRQVHLRLQHAHISPERLEIIREMVGRFPGKCPLLLNVRFSSGAAVFLETHDHYWVTPSRQLQQAADEMFGEETYYAKVDTSLPERAQRRWPKRGEGE